MTLPPSALTNLRVITQRLTFTPAWQIPNIVVHLANSLTTCKAILATADLRQRNQGSDAAILVHKFKTQLSALLQDRSPDARWVAIVLIKATIENGGWEVQRGCGAWVRGLLGVLSKSDPPTTKQLCIITLTRIFQLIQEHQSLVREITTPSLPGYITSCLNLVKSRTLPSINSNSHETTLDAILQSFGTLLPHHPTLFRPFLTQIRSLIIPLLAATPSSLVDDEDLDQRPLASGIYIAHSSRHLFALLSNCAPKNNYAQDWAESVQSIINSLHKSADKAFRAVVENWESSASQIPPSGNLSHNFTDNVCSLDEDHLGLPSWRGVHAGIERIDGLLHSLKAFLTAPTKLSVKIPIGAFIDVTERILSITLPSSENENEYGVPIFNPEAGKEERDGLWTGLPIIHVTALEVLSLLILRLGRNSAIACHVILERSLWVFEAEYTNDHIRATVYKLVSDILRLLGWSLPKSIAPSLSNCVNKCCEDLTLSKNQIMPTDDSAPDNTAGPVQRQTDSSGSKITDSHLGFPTRSASDSKNQETIRIAAELLLSVSVSHVPRGFFHDSLRVLIDKTAILIKSRPTILASALNPPIRQNRERKLPSMVSLLAREFHSSLEVQMLVQPRMPITKTQKDNMGDIVSYVNPSKGLEEETSNAHKQISENLGTQLMDVSLPFENKELHEQLRPGFSEIRASSETKSNAPSPRAPDAATLPNSQQLARETYQEMNEILTSAGTDNLNSITSSELNGLPKRARLEVDSSDVGELIKSPEIEHALAQRDSSVVSEEPSSVTPKGATWTQTTAKPARELDTSDESDFEMPVIDLQSDTSLEDDDRE